jgi:hypothetical protein
MPSAIGRQDFHYLFEEAALYHGIQGPEHQEREGIDQRDYPDKGADRAARPPMIPLSKQSEKELQDLLGY